MSRILLAQDPQSIIKATQGRFDSKTAEAVASWARRGQLQFGGAAGVLEEKAGRADAVVNVLAKRQLEEVLRYEMASRPTLGLFAQFRDLIRVGSSSAKTWTQSVYEGSGDVAYTAQGGSDGIPMVNQAGVEVERPYHEIRNGFSWDMEEREAADRGDFDMLTEARNDAIRYHEIEWNRVFFYGYGALQLDGLVNFPNIRTQRSPDNGDSSSRYIADKSPDNAAEDLFTLCDTIQQTSEGAFATTDVLLSDSVYDYVSRARMTDGDRNTILSYVQSQRGGVRFHRVIELGSSYRANARNSARIGNSITSTVGLAFDRSHVSLRAGMTPRILAPVANGPFEYIFGCRSRIGGIKNVKPGSMFRLTEMAA